MRVRHSKKSIPRNFASHRAAKDRLVAACDILIRSDRGLRAKLLVFKNPTAMRRFWTEAFGRDLGRGCVGAVNPLAYEQIDKQGHRTLVVDPRYFCLIGLCLGRLNMEIICHEAAHAGFCYAKRRSGDHWTSALEFDEEKVCYPAGKIARGINSFLHDEGLY